jgi:hypothetical protein
MGEAGSTVITGLGEGTGLKGHSPWDRYVIGRRSATAGEESRFFAVLEPFGEATYLDGVTPIRSGSGCAGVRVDVGDAIHYAIHGGPDGGFDGEVDGHRVSMSGEWAFVEVRSGRVSRVQTVGVTALTFGRLRLEGQAGPSGTVEAIDVAGRSLLVASGASLPVGDALKGQTLLIGNPGYICNSSYPISNVEAEGKGRYRIHVPELSFLLSEGQVKRVDVEAGTLETDTPMLKLEVVQGLFDGKVVSSVEGEAGPRLRAAEKGRLVLAASDDTWAFDDKPFYVYDVGPDDRWWITPSVCAQATDGGYDVQSPFPATVTEGTG